MMNAFVSNHTRIGDNHQRINQGMMSLECDTEANDKSQRDADVLNAMLAEQSKQDELERDYSFQQLAPTEQRLQIERDSLPVLKRAIEQKEAAKEALDVARSQVDIEAARHTIDFARRHPSIQRVYCINSHVKQSYLEQGKFNVEGYHIGGFEQGAANDGKAETVLLFPDGISSIADFAKLDDSVAYGKQKALEAVTLAEGRFKQSQVQLASVKKDIKAKLESIITLEQLLK
ncbi:MULTISPECIES: hypothetical protein [Pectobacterium]|uniref:Uncharacterized protein n=2 Tax=Pectobacterium TaxID=122277 RepID=A0AAW3EIP2_9GAMM|nr:MULTISPECIES: hypothetical protein [Pectobacterium]AOR62295.1 hypothetical protein A7983_03230 [Pectobacterium wasabiae CFBP 3304]EJS92957.1 Hypothetical protein Y17_3783 [Pectobacterium wasabiae CFBP 3304]KFX06339.1 hypothetical protein JV38_11500 [Pectobacterium wasabiae]KGA28174.1 hypothetical protein KU73_13065 [Pectobacterium wasabiae]RRO06981.1 hypothetical protein DMB85_015150 [Pectobacterium aquaticum]